MNPDTHVQFALTREPGSVVLSQLGSGDDPVTVLRVQNHPVTFLFFWCIRMWKATAGQSVKVAPSDEVDDWETDPDFEVPSPTFPCPAHC